MFFHVITSRLIIVVSTIWPSPSCHFFSLPLFPRMFLPCCIAETNRSSSSCKQASPDRLFDTIKGARDRFVYFLGRTRINLFCWDQGKIWNLPPRDIRKNKIVYKNYIFFIPVFIFNVKNNVCNCMLMYVTFWVRLYNAVPCLLAEITPGIISSMNMWTYRVPIITDT